MTSPPPGRTVGNRLQKPQRNVQNGTWTYRDSALVSSRTCGATPRASISRMNLLVETNVQCPYCGETFALTIDTSQGETETTEDCTVCCRPIAFSIECEPGEVLGVTAGIG